MSAQQPQYTHVEIDGDGACGYSAQALTCALYILQHDDATPGMNLLLQHINLYYETEMTYEALRTFLRQLTTRYDVQQFLAPVIYTWQQEIRRSESADHNPRPSSITGNQAYMADIETLNQQLGLNAGFHGQSHDGRVINPSSPNPDFIYQVNGYHYNLFVNTATYPADQYEHLIGNSGRYGVNSRYPNGYLYSQGLTQYGVEDITHSRLKVGNLIRAHMNIEALPIPASIPVSRTQTSSTSLTQLLPEYRDNGVLEINRRTNQLLDQVFNGSKISDEIAQMIAQGLERISNAASNEARLSLITSLESTFRTPARSATVFRDSAAQHRPTGVDHSSAAPWLAAQA